MQHQIDKCKQGVPSIVELAKGRVEEIALPIKGIPLSPTIPKTPIFYYKFYTNKFISGFEEIELFL